MIKNSVYKKRRARLLKKISKGKGNSIAVIANAEICLRNGRDNEYPARADSNFWYLTGFSEPGAVLVLAADGEGSRSVIFCQESVDFVKAAFDGDVIGTVGAKKRFGFDTALSIDTIDAVMPKMFCESDTLYYHMGQRSDLDRRVMSWVGEAKSASYRRGAPPITAIEDLDVLLSEMRLIKSPEEIGLLTRAGHFTGGGIIKAMQSCRPGMMEYQLEAKIHEWFRYHGCGGMPAFSAIVAGGANATTLHYVDNNCLLKDGDLVLTDVGGEFELYSGDISRTFPVNGKFSEAQKRVYQIVLLAQKAAIQKVVVGNSLADCYAVAARIITEGLADLKILDGDVEELIALGMDSKNPPEASYKKFFMHRTGHWLGLDTHDVGSYFNSDGTHRAFEAGMVLTAEPGIYIKPAPDVPEEYWNIGIRIEDDVLVEKFGEPFVLTSDAPKEIADIEEVMSFHR
ncbi:MAG: aminopeptidase P N-terminal domain-containing protein [Candidatus Paceibacterota bacterium]|jgi:Xaa-Pro aminopeptidase|nr:aminopeptidase P N-terminal domain-containing protein [Candidatus Paceibacterota bacterium]